MPRSEKSSAEVIKAIDARLRRYAFIDQPSIQQIARENRVAPEFVSERLGLNSVDYGREAVTKADLKSQCLSAFAAIAGGIIAILLLGVIVAAHFGWKWYP